MSSSAVLTPESSPALTSPVPGGLPDFSERLSPMLVKELRQGMRSPVFVWGLIVMNLFLAVVVFMGMADPDERDLHRAFFGAYCVLVCGLLPLRAAGALHDEMRGNTLDTLVLTRLTGWRIALGKWVAVAAQQALTAVTVLPYLIVRYFVGGVNVPMELAWLGIFLLAGMGSAAILTGFSWIRYFLMRAAVMMGMTFAVGAFCVAVLDEMYGYRRDYLLDDMYEKGGWAIFALLLAPALHLAFFSLDLGAAKVSSLVENSSVRRRLTGVAFILFYAGMALWGAVTESSYSFDYRTPLSCVLLGGTVFLVGVQALLETPVNYSVVLLPWVKRGRAGRLAGRFLYPGWPSGVCYTAALAGLVIVAVVLCILLPEVSLGWADNPRELCFLIVGTVPVLAMMVVPLVLWRAFLSRRMSWHLGTFVVLLGIMVAQQLLVIAVAAGIDRLNVLKWGAHVPTMAWSWLAESRGMEGIYRPEMPESDYFDWGYATVAAATLGVACLWWLLAFWAAFRGFRITRAVEAETAAILAAEKEKPHPVEPDSRTGAAL